MMFILMGQPLAYNIKVYIDLLIVSVCFSLLSVAAAFLSCGQVKSQGKNMLSVYLSITVQTFANLPRCSSMLAVYIT